MNLFKKLILNKLDDFGYEVRKKSMSLYDDLPVELSNDDIELIKWVKDNNFTMVRVPRIISTIKSCKYVVENSIPGDFVECGVWRGGIGIVAQKTFERMGSDKKVWMYDTFTGMTEPTEHDQKNNNEKAINKYLETKNDAYTDWCYASLEDVKRNFELSDVDYSSVKFIKGDVSKTLLVKNNLPAEIAILRLDTDWYESTKMEMETLYPLLSPNGVLEIDDYGHWKGSRKAVDEYLSDQKYKPLLNVVDHTARSCLKLEI